MKNTIFYLLLCIASVSYSQNSGIGTTSPHTSAALEVSSTTQGVLPPRMTTAQRTAITSPAAGLMVYNTDINCLETYNGTAWENMCCGIIGETALVRGAAGKIWMAYNLGATAPPASIDDYTQYGSLYQWGRASDGHEIVTWTSPSTATLSPTTTNLSASSNPGHSSFIITNNSTANWISPFNNNLWQGVNGVNNPCPTGFRVPTRQEWYNELAAAKITNATTSAYNSCLKLTGNKIHREYDDVLLISSFYYWTSDFSQSDNRLAKAISISNVSGFIYETDLAKASGVFVRCIKD